MDDDTKQIYFKAFAIALMTVTIIFLDCLVIWSAFYQPILISSYQWVTVVWLIASNISLGFLFGFLYGGYRIQKLLKEK